MKQKHCALIRQVAWTAEIFAALVYALVPGFSYGLPVGGQVNAGQANISSTAMQTTIDQTSQRAVIDWDSFNVGSNETVQFVQPSSSAIALNRIHDSGTSAIDGQLLANGNVWLINPNGILFGKNAQVNVGGCLLLRAISVMRISCPAIIPSRPGATRTRRWRMTAPSR
jgi:filamentous hemagglutinin family protein